MLIYLDTVIIIYAIEGKAPFKARAMNRLAAAKAAGDDLATSHLTRGECLVKPVRTSDQLLVADYLMFLSQTVVVDHPAKVFDRMAQIRAGTNFKIPDALHLATAIESNCALFLTNDNRLAGFSGIKIDILP